jgi:gliding motility-associated-like protein
MVVFFIRFLLVVIFQLYVVLAYAQLDDTIMIQNSDTLYCSNPSLPMIATTLSGLEVKYEIIAGHEFASLNDTTISPLGLGVFMLRAYTDGNVGYKPFSKTIPMSVVSTQSINAFKITNDLPVRERDSLYLSVPSWPGFSYVWTTPRGIVDSVVTIAITNIQKSDQGIYRVDVFENTCRIGQDSINVMVEDNSTVLIIYELITPNGDDKNDFFYIENLQNSPNTEVSIFNAWNQIVYHSTAYKNDWDGGGLPSGNYYYLVKEKDCRCEAHKGIVYIKR